MFNFIKNFGNYYDDYYYSTRYFSQPDESTIGILLLISIIVSIVVYFTFLSKKNEHKFTGFAGWLYQFLNFGKLMVEGLLKITYIILALFFSLISIVEMTHHFGEGLLFLIVWNIILRVIYEFALITIMICKNTSEINRKLKNQNVDKNQPYGNRMNPNNIPPQQYGQPYNQGGYGQAPYGQQPVNRPPMGMQQPVNPQQPAGMQQPVNPQQPVGMQQPVNPQQPAGVQQPVRPQQPAGMQQPVNPQQPAGMQQPVNPQQPAGMQQPVNPQQPKGMQQPVNSQQPTGMQQPMGTTQSQETDQVAKATSELKNLSCPNCGCPIEEDDMFCPNCGTKVANK